MPTSLISGGNLLNAVTAYPLHTLIADEEAAGHEASRIATGRRSPYTNYYTAITANQQRTLTLTCDRVRSASFFVLDRGHNLGGKQVVLECSDDNFATTQTAFDIVLPSVTTPQSLDDAFGCRTEEGAWVKRFPLRAALYWRLRIPAMGANLRPVIVGAHLSLPFTFDPWRPWGPDQDELGGDMSESDAGWQGTSQVWTRNVDTLRIQLLTLYDYELARQTFGQHFAKRRPTWYVPDDSQAQNAKCIIRPMGVGGFVRAEQWFSERADIPYQEFEAA